MGQILHGGPSPYACAHYVRGRCLRAEALNPGLNEEHLCPRLCQLMREWDDFLDRAEMFGLEEDVAMRIWEGRHHTSLERCPHGPGSLVEGDGMACDFLHQSLCLLRLPRCAARCAHYQRKG